MIAALALCSVGCAEHSQRSEASAPAIPDVLSLGREVYRSNCLSCHQADGLGVPSMQPALWPSPVVAGDPTKMIEMTLRGIGASETSLPPSGDYANAMPAYDTLSDEQIAACLTYIRRELAGLDENGVSATQVRRVRDQLP